MGNYLIKHDRDADWYVYWSTVVDAPLDWGGRVSLMAGWHSDELTDERWDRADANGTSANWPDFADAEQIYGWHDKSLPWMEGSPDRDGGWWRIPRKNLRAVCEALDPISGRPTRDVTDLLEWDPFPDEGAEPEESAR